MNFVNKNNKGFTLIELLIVIGLIGMIGTILVNIVLGTLRGSNKGTVVSSIRSEGNYSMQSMVRALQNASSFQGVSNDYGNTFTKPCPATSTSYNAVEINTSTIISCPNNGSKGFFSSINDNLTVSSCSISCSQSNDADNPTFIIDFTVSQGGR